MPLLLVPRMQREFSGGGVGLSVAKPTDRHLAELKTILAEVSYINYLVFIVLTCVKVVFSTKLYEL